MRAHSGASASIPTCAVPKTVADILTEAADLIAKPGMWTQGAASKDQFGEADDDCVLLPDAVCWCAYGALLVVSGETRIGETGRLADRAADVLEALVGDTVPAWNDTEGRTQAEVVAAFRAAAEKARTAVEGHSVGTQPGLPGEVKQSPANQEQVQPSDDGEKT